MNAFRTVSAALAVVCVMWWPGQCATATLAIGLADLGYFRNTDLQSGRWELTFQHTSGRSEGELLRTSSRQ